MLENVNAKGEAASMENNAEVKSDVVAAYHELLHKLKQSKKPVLHVAGADDDLELDDAVSTDDTAQQEHFLQEISREKPGDYARATENLKHMINTAIDDVREKCFNEQNRLLTLMDAIERKSKKIDEVHGIEVNIDTIGALNLAQKEKSRSFEEEMQDRRQQFEQEMAAKRRELQQEEQKYLYQRDLGREKDQNRYEVSKRDLDQELSELRQRVNKELEEREARVGSAEALSEKISQFPEELRIAAQKAKEATTKQLTIQFEYENQLSQKEIQLRDQRIATLETNIESLESSITHFEALKNSFNHLLFSKTDA